MAKVLKYVLGMDNKNRFESFYSAGAPAQDFVRYSAVDNLDGHVTDEEFDVDFFRSRWHRDPKNAERGCMLSHLNMWRDFLASDADWALIAEDDIIISADAEPVVQNIIAKYPQVQMVVLCDAFALEAGKMNPRVTYPRISLLSPFVYGKYRMGGKYSLTRLTGTGLYLISRSGAELLLKNFDKGTPGTVADDYPCTRNGAWTCATYSLAYAIGKALASSKTLAFATLKRCIGVCKLITLLVACVFC